MLLAFAVALAPAVATRFVVPPASDVAEAPYADWAHHHWIWLHNAEHNQNNNTQIIQEYLARGIRVGAYNIDSRWDIGGRGSFEFDPERYPDPQAMLNYIRLELGLRVTLWTTSVINIDSPTYQYAFDNNYFYNDGNTIDWWRGTGSFIDYTNPEAMEWYHSLMKRILDMGVDGWKCDGTDPLLGLLRPKPVMGQGGEVLMPDNAEWYYGDYYNFTNNINGEKTSLIMARPVDWFLSQPLVYAPYYVLFSGWVGDQDGDFFGLKHALTYMLHAGRRGFLAFGSDIGGYRGPVMGGERTKETLVRWAQLGALCPFMENGGGGEHRPWMFDEETVDIYRRYVDVHYALGSYFLTNGANGYEDRISILRPVTDLGDGLIPTSWNYLLGNDIFVAPMVNDTYERLVEFPTGSRWVSWWDNSAIYDGGALVTVPVPLSEYPVYRREGAIIPLDIIYGDLPFNTPSMISENPVVTLSVVAQRGSKFAESTVVRQTFGPGLRAEVAASSETIEFAISAFDDKEIVLRLSGSDIRPVAVLSLDADEKISAEVPFVESSDATASAQVRTMMYVVRR
eukprot:TRINITY_DN1593_c1_g1_i2.p1 TRINITY_DN1593_c1_g1~~TRINITY_DN1593_c1_g1_i2.p1  ORF type:complete len:579 (-),score=136.73 TRINITY_DN1593_c1_g1_i2:202-1902(-)